MKCNNLQKPILLTIEAKNKIYHLLTIRQINRLIYVE